MDFDESSLTGKSGPDSIAAMRKRADIGPHGIAALQRPLVPLLLLVGLVSATSARGDDATWEFFSQEGRAFEALRADPREARFRFGVLYGDDGFFEDIAIGGDLAFFSVRFPFEGLLTVTGRGLITGRFDVTSRSFDLMNTDFVGGVATGLRWDAFSWELLFFHQSSHLGDELLERGEYSRIDLGYEALRLLADWRWRFLRLIGGVEVTVHAYPGELLGRTLLEAGVETTFSPGNVSIYVALNVQGRVDRPLLQGACLQTGIGLGPGDAERRLQYVFVELFEGRSAMGQFYADRERYILLGLSYLFQ